MGVEVAGSEMPKVNGEAMTKPLDLKGRINFSEVITFGSHDVDEVPSTGEANNVSNANFPKDAVDEWPEAVQTHYFYFVKHRQYEDPSLNAQAGGFGKDIEEKEKKFNELLTLRRDLQAKKQGLINEMQAFNGESSQNRAFINEKREEMKPLQNALGSLRGSGGEKGFGICSTEEELNQLIRSIEYRMQHETMTLKEEKQLLREIKELEATRPKVIANSAMRAKIQESMGPKEALQDQVKLLGTDLDGVRKKQAAIKAKKSRLGLQVDALKKKIKALDNEIDEVKAQKTAAVASRKDIKNTQEKGNEDYFESRNILKKAKDIAVKKDVKALEEFNKIEVERFMTKWNSSKAFRDGYEKKLLRSLDYRQLSRDGRIRNFDEKPLVRTESPRPSETEVAPKVTIKQQKEVKTTVKAENLPGEKAQEELKKGSKESKIASERALETEDVFVVEKPKKDVSKDNEIDNEKLRKEEEKEKQRQALERKKKKEDKAAAKAAHWTQQLAEKKKKEHEKKQKKKQASNVMPTNEEEPAENPETDKPENSDDVEEVVEAPAPSKAKVQLGNSLRHRKPIKTRGTLPKAILKKKKSDKYWLWGSAAAAAALGVLLLLVLGFKYL